ncbi:MAG: hypothetical protein A2492_05070 [Ignavibacteria bacterium RIFOXYC12_FULL_35_11]|nr:MAG: hypothetical protein A2492_05070 [Ignavibacteria bacterium RIFOXYC12_FULL_35_11]
MKISSIFLSILIFLTQMLINAQTGSLKLTSENVIKNIKDEKKFQDIIHRFIITEPPKKLNKVETIKKNNNQTEKNLSVSVNQVFQLAGNDEPNSCDRTQTVYYKGKTYHTLQVGTQCWLKENLDVGTMIISRQESSNNGVIEKYCYGGRKDLCDYYGGLYKWDEAMQYKTTPKVKGICPTGWHIPTKTDFEKLMVTVNNDGNSLKAKGFGYEDGEGTNTSGFSALLAGTLTKGRLYINLGYVAYFWTSTEENADSDLAYYLYLNNSNSSINLFCNVNKDYAFSIRCLKD